MKKGRREFIKITLFSLIPGVAPILNLFFSCKPKGNLSRISPENYDKVYSDFEPSYLSLHRKGELKKRVNDFCLSPPFW